MGPEPRLISRSLALMECGISRREPLALRTSSLRLKLILVASFLNQSMPFAWGSRVSKKKSHSLVWLPSQSGSFFDCLQPQK